MDPANFLNSKRHFTILFSGGKDSLAALLWILEHVKNNNFLVLHIVVSGNSHHLSTEYVRDICKELGVYNKLEVVRREDLDFFDCLKKWGVPLLGKYRWCLYQFKIKLILNYASTVQVTGIRRAEGHWRRKIKLVDFLKVTKLHVLPVLQQKANNPYNARFYLERKNPWIAKIR